MFLLISVGLVARAVATGMAMRSAGFTRWAAGSGMYKMLSRANHCCDPSAALPDQGCARHPG
jgi:hypothetical protein